MLDFNLKTILVLLISFPVMGVILILILKLFIVKKIKYYLYSEIQKKRNDLKKDLRKDCWNRTYVHSLEKIYKFFYFLTKPENISLIITMFIFGFSILILWKFSYLNDLKKSTSIIFFDKIDIQYFIFKENYFSFIIGIDGISLFLILLTTFIFVICNIIGLHSINKHVSFFYILFLMLEFFILFAFLILDFLIFYILFEVLLIPMFLIIGIWGSRNRRTKAANYFLFYAFFGSLFMLIGIFMIYFTVGDTSWYSSFIYNYNLDTQKILWFLFFIGFAIKVPLWPFHIWLPEAHVEAPTIGSIILAALLLKLGGYGFLRFVLPIFTDATRYFLPLVITLCVIGIIYASLSTLRQVDMKRIIAYSSVAHMSYGMLGIFSLNYYGILGGLIIMLAHGLVSSALFYLVGILYDLYGTRLLKYYGGLVQVMPMFAFFFFFFTIANMGLPGLFIFVGEFLVTIGIFVNNTFAAILSVLSSVLTVGYMILLYNKIIFGTLKISEITRFKDIGKKEFFILFLLSFLTLFFGIYPQFLIQNIEFSIINTLRFYDTNL